MLGYRAISGHCHMYQMLGVNTDEHDRTLQGNLGIKVDREIVVNVPPERAYRVWRNFTNLPRFMSHLERVEEIDRTRSRWTSQTPTGVRVSWEAEMIKVNGIAKFMGTVPMKKYMEEQYPEIRALLVDLELAKK